MFFFFNGDDVQGNFQPGTLPLRDELLLHQSKAHEAAKLIFEATQFVPNKPRTYGSEYSRNPNAPDQGVAVLFWRSLDPVVRCSRAWPDTSPSASASLAAGAQESGLTRVKGLQGSSVLATALTGKRLVEYVESVQSAHEANGDPIEVIVARHLTDCLADYESSEIGSKIGAINFKIVAEVIDSEVAAAIMWAVKYLTRQDVSTPAAPSAATKPAAKREAAPVTRTKAETWKLVAAYLFYAHEVDNLKLGKIDPVKFGDLCDALKISRGGAASSWFKEHFGSHKEYTRLCVRNPDKVAILLSGLQGETLSVEESTSRGSREDGPDLDELDPSKDRRRRNHDSDDDDSDD